jgi:creatinine amidohydrolase/Fe(II)-dependent formamide hydrolase-like protein
MADTLRESAMTESGVRRHVFISHHHKDDALVTQLSELLKSNGWDIRNSSIRAKPANQQRIDNGLVDPKVIQRLLRMKISWAKTVLVLIGQETHTRQWVNWEIEEANAQGKRIVGVFAHGGQNADIPAALDKYASAMVAWNTNSIVHAIEGATPFEMSDGSPRPAPNAGSRTQC